jgi:hypothetical protein
LNDIRRIDAPLNPPAKPLLDHRTQRRTMPFKKSIECAWVPGLNFEKQPLGLGRVRLYC